MLGSIFYRSVSLAVALLVAHSVEAQQAVPIGTIVLRDGNEIPFMGFQKRCGDPIVFGRFGGESLTVKLLDLVSISFPDKARYDDREQGRVEGVNKAGRTFVLDKGIVQSCNRGYISYRIINPITSEEQDAFRGAGEIARIVFGEKPGAAIGGGAAVAVDADYIVLKNGDTISGIVVTEKVSVQTSYTTLTFDRKDVSQVVLEGGGQNIDGVVLKNGDRLSGVAGPTDIRMKLATGQEVALGKDKIKELRFKK